MAHMQVMRIQMMRLFGFGKSNLGDATKDATETLEARGARIHPEVLHEAIETRQASGRARP
jgi:hypothetical protein